MNLNTALPAIALALLFAAPSFAAGPTAATGDPSATVPTSREDRDERKAIKHYNLDKQGLAIDGYDPVAYFPEGGGKPRKGKKELAHTYRKVTYYFASNEHRELFKKNPGHYEPAYGGWCSFAMSQNKQVDPDPKSFHIDEDGHLYLFYKSLFANNRKKWLKDEVKLRSAADANWKEISGEDGSRSR